MDGIDHLNKHPRTIYIDCIFLTGKTFFTYVREMSNPSTGGGQNTFEKSGHH